MSNAADQFSPRPAPFNQGILCDREITELVLHGNMISPFIDKKVTGNGPSHGLSHFGYDIRLGPGYFRFNGAIDYPDKQYELEAINIFQEPHRPITEQLFASAGEHLILSPLEFLLAESVEEFHLPDDVFAVLTNKSTLARIGLSQPSTTLEPGWKGKLTLELFNCHSRRAMFLRPGMGIAQIIFFRGSPPNTTYGEHGTYQRQVGVTEAKVSNR